MVQEGTLDEISVGGRIIEKSEVRDADDKIIQVDVTKWELLEASLVTIGADANAGVNRNLNTGENVNLEEIRREIQSIQAKLKAEKDESIQRALREEQSKLETEALKLENNELKHTIANDKRKEKILFIARKHNIGNDDESLQRFLSDENKTDKDFGLEILERMVEKQVHVGFKREDNGSAPMKALEDSLLMRVGIPVVDAHPDVERYIGASLLDIARYVTGYDGHNPQEIVHRALSTSHLPNLLLSVAKRVLDTKWEQADTTYQHWTGVDYFDDFRKKQFVNLDGVKGLCKEKLENGEAVYIGLSESGRSWGISRKGGKLTLSDVMLINDDLGAFFDLIEEIVFEAKRTINTHVYDMLLKEGVYKNYLMDDNKPIFHQNHKNIGTASIKTEDSIDELDGLIGEQKDKDGKALNIQAKYILVGRKGRLKAKRLVMSGSTTNDSGNSGQINPLKDEYVFISEQRLGEKYFLASSRKTITVGFLNGNTDHMPIIEISDRTLEGITFNVVLDFGVTCEDYRGLAMNEGAE
jgi:hypothetical protein